MELGKEKYKTFINSDGRPRLNYDFIAEDGDLFSAQACDLNQARRMCDWIQELRAEHRCSRCGQAKNDVEERYSFGVYAGRLCVQCCVGYRDRCGLDQPQGDPRVLEAEGEVYWEEGGGEVHVAA